MVRDRCRAGDVVYVNSFKSMLPWNFRAEAVVGKGIMERKRRKMLDNDIKMTFGP